MKNTVTILFLVVFLTFCHQSYACSCPSLSIDREVEKAYDIVIGKITSEKNEWVSCMYPEGAKEYEFTTSYTYTLQTEFSYKGKLSGTHTIRGGKGKGDCGAILDVGKEYVIVVQNGDRGLFSTLCSDNAVISEASSQLEFLNTYFGKDYNIKKGDNNEMDTLLIIVAILTLILIVFGFYTSRKKIKTIV